MHDTKASARMPALGSSAGQPKGQELLHRFDDQREVKFKGENYLVRDNGAVLRRARPSARRRKLDEIWTFGTPDKHSGYFTINGHVIHRIVATAFCGEKPSSEHVVDHIDTNRLNNRAENLRWVTRLENILLNPITRRRIELAFGSLETFFENPGLHTVPNWEWMRTVSKEEAAASRIRLLEWAAKEQGPRGWAIGDWVFESSRTGAPRGSHAQPGLRPPPSASETPCGLGDAPDRRPSSPPIREATSGATDTPSLTPGAIQRNWRTPTEFPLCPETTYAATLDDYLAKLQPGVVFARNRYGESWVEAAEKTANLISVVCRIESGVKDWSVANVSIAGDVVCHQSGGTFFTKEGAMKAHLRTLGVAFDESLYESIDDYA